MKPFLSCLVGLSVLTASAAAQTPPAADDAAPASVEDVVVVAKRVGAPLWKAVGKDGGVIFVVGDIGPVPAGLDWRSQALKDAVVKSRRVVLPEQSNSNLFATLWHSFGLLFNFGRLSIPHGKRLEDVVGADLVRRAAPFVPEKKLGAIDWRKTKPQFVALSILSRETHGGLDKGESAAKAAVAAAKNSRVRRDTVNDVGPGRIIDLMDKLTPEQGKACLEATVASAEAGKAPMQARAEAWAGGRVEAVQSAPFERAMALCTPYLRREVIQDWAKMAQHEFSHPGAVVFVTPMTALIGDDGLIAQWRKQGLEVVRFDSRYPDGVPPAPAAN